MPGPCRRWAASPWVWPTPSFGSRRPIARPARGSRSSAGFHALTSGLIAYPLVWETTTRFHLLSPPPRSAILVAVFGAGIAVTARHRLGSVAWVVTSLALGTTAGLLLTTHHLLAAVLALLAMAAVVEGLAQRDLWLDLRWPAALVLDAALAALVLVGSRPGGPPEGYPALPLGAAVAAALGLTALYTASIVARTLGRGSPVTLFELLQGTAALVLGLGGARELLAPQGFTVLGGLSLLLGALSYAAAFAFVERRTGHARNFYFYSTVGSLLTLVGSRAILDDTALSVAFCLLALASAGLGRRFARSTLRFHAAVYLVAAAFVTDLLAASWRELFAPAGSWPLPGLGGWITAAAAFLGYAILAAGPRPGQECLGAAPPGHPGRDLGLDRRRNAGGALALAAVGASASAPAVLATLRTGVLALLAVGLGGAARRWSLPELAWFVYPLLAIGGLKLVTEDLREGRPATLFVSLVLYGGALIAAPRLMRRGE